jgi:hypothetical protein
MGNMFSNKLKTDHTNFKGAGCIFTNGTHILGGYQPHKTSPVISGFGGKRKEYESFTTTAFRETIEELFDIKDVPKYLIDVLENEIPPSKAKMEDGYIILIYNFDDLTHLLNEVRTYFGMVKLYPYRFPKDMHELIMNREVHKDSEVSHLCLLPVVNNLQFDPLFVKDINNLN